MLLLMFLGHVGGLWSWIGEVLRKMFWLVRLLDAITNQNQIPASDPNGRFVASQGVYIAWACQAVPLLRPFSSSKR